MAAGLLFITSQTGGGWINHTGGELVLNSINPSAQQTNIPLIRQTGGFLRVSNSYLVMPGGLGAWTTVPAIQSTGGTIVFENNFLSPMPPGSTQPGLFISTDNASHVVQGNFLNGWSWTPPGSLGSYGLNSDGHSRQSVQFAAVQVKSPAGGPTGMGMVANSGQQRALVVNTGNELDPASYRWQWIFGTNAAETGANAGTNFLLYRYDDTGNVLGTPALTITRSNGEFFVDRLKMNTFGLNIATPVGRQTVTGSRASGAALVSLLNAMAAFGLILDSTTA
jgi:hypothetical protein